MHQRIDLKQAIYGLSANLGDDDVMTSKSEGVIFARNMVKDLSQRVRFSDEDQRKIDQL